MSESDRDGEIIRAWCDNAGPWARAIENGEIRSRVTVTNRAIIDAVTEYRPASVADIGCGEGWLARELRSRGLAVTGVDAVPELVERARLGGGDFRVCSYAGIADGTHALDRFEAAVCNFSLIGGAEVDGLIGSLGGLLTGPRLLFIQTLHPVAACGESPYREGWREGSWAGFGPEFTTAPPWYFRPIETWIRLLRQAGFGILEVREPAMPGAAMPVSMILIARHGER